VLRAAREHGFEPQLDETAAVWRLAALRRV